MFSTQLDMKDTTLSNGVNVEQTIPGEPFWPGALASNSAIGGQVFARPHNETVIRISYKRFCQLPGVFVYFFGITASTKYYCRGFFLCVFEAINGDFEKFLENYEFFR